MVLTHHLENTDDDFVDDGGFTVAGVSQCCWCLDYFFFAVTLSIGWPVVVVVVPFFSKISFLCRTL